MFNSAEDIDKFVLYSARIFNRLGHSVSKEVAQGKDAKHQPKGKRRSLQILHLLTEMPENKR